MRTIYVTYTASAFCWCFMSFYVLVNHLNAQSKYGQHDTILTVAVVYEGDTIEAKILAGVYVWGKSNTYCKRKMDKA